jgi:ribosomal-protein-alanine N-acetyltransferase
MPIRVVPARLDWLTALAEGDDVFTERFGVLVEPGWIGFPEALPFAVDAAREHDADAWGPHLFFDDDGALVGFGGFKGPPSASRVEIGYAVAPSRQGRGIATAATRWMIDRARARGVDAVVAHTLAEVNASTAVLERCGFVHVATTADPDGDVHDDVYRWQLVLGSDAALKNRIG